MRPGFPWCSALRRRPLPRPSLGSRAAGGEPGAGFRAAGRDPRSRIGGGGTGAIAGKANAAEEGPQLAWWGNWHGGGAWRNGGGGWRNGGGGGWRNGGGGWRNGGWHNGWHNYWRNW